MPRKNGITPKIGTCTPDVVEEALVCVPPRNNRFTKEEWYLNNTLKKKAAEDQQQIAERVIGECERIRELTEERTKANKETTDRRFIERVGDIEYNKGELERQRKEVCLELEALDVYKTRLIDCLASLRENALNQCKKCIMLRERRTGVDLVLDEVELALQKEISILLGGQDLLKKALEQTVEQMRRLRATQYAMDNDLEQKAISVVIDLEGARLKPSDLSIKIYKGYANMDPAIITNEQWESYSTKNIESSAKEINSARPIRVLVDTLLKQVYEDLLAVNKECNIAFQVRIAETKLVKSRLEEVLAETVKKVDQMNKNINLLEKALADKEGYLALAHTRLGKRAQRPGAELVKDGVCISLATETQMLQASTEQLNRTLEEAQASLRYLLQTQMQLEEDINVKTNSLKIDEVECGPIRDAMEYHWY